jgi:hypothetical protein
MYAVTCNIIHFQLPVGVIVKPLFDTHRLFSCLLKGEILVAGGGGVTRGLLKPSSCLYFSRISPLLCRVDTSTFKTKLISERYVYMINRWS